MPDQTVAVVGDIHGREDLLIRLMAQLETDAAAQDVHKIIFAGDYVDRGDDSAAVLTRLHHLDQDNPKIVCLLGNHEDMLLSFLDAPDKHGPMWLRNGGLQTLASYGIGGLTETSRALAEVATALRTQMPAGLETWLRALPRQWASGNLHVVHAGADPDLPMAIQPDDVLTWGHPQFFQRARTDGLWIVHGHTVTETPGANDTGQIAVDTGAYFSNSLTAAIISPQGEIQLIQT